MATKKATKAVEFKPEDLLQNTWLRRKRSYWDKRLVGRRGFARHAPGGNLIPDSADKAERITSPQVTR